jgi:hypothetical protein
VIDQWTKNSSGGLVNGSVGQGVTAFGGGYENTKRAMTSANGSLGNTTRNGAMAYCWNKSTSSANDRWYLPNVMEYAYIFKQVSQTSSFRSSFPGVPPATNYYTSEEAWNGWDSAYQNIWNSGNPPPGVSLVIYPTSGSTQNALSVQPMNSSNVLANQNYSDYARMSVFSHGKNSGYAVMCLRAFR